MQIRYPSVSRNDSYPNWVFLGMPRVQIRYIACVPRNDSRLNLVTSLVSSSTGVSRNDSRPEERESVLNLWGRTVNLRRPGRARHEGSAGPERLDDTRCNRYLCSVTWQHALHRIVVYGKDINLSPAYFRWTLPSIPAHTSHITSRLLALGGHPPPCPHTPLQGYLAHKKTSMTMTLQSPYV